MRNKTKNHLNAFRLTDWEQEMLDKAVKITKQSKTNFITMAILQKAEDILKYTK